MYKTEDGIVVVSHDGAARQETVRRLADRNGKNCSWCGGYRWVTATETYYPSPKLFEFGTRPDDSNRTNWHSGLFCSKSCHDSYHQL